MDVASREQVQIWKIATKEMDADFIIKPLEPEPIMEVSQNVNMMTG